MRQPPNSTTLNPSMERISAGEIVSVGTDASSNFSENLIQGKNLYFSNPLSEIDPLILTSSIPNVFEEFVRSLPTELQLTRGGFVIAHTGSEIAASALSLIAISDIDTVCAGLGIAIPVENSALHEVSDSSCLKTVTPAKRLKGNFVERHALIVSADGCLGMYPLAIDKSIIGVVTLNFSKSSACYNASKEIALANTRLARSIAKVAPRIAPETIVSLEF